MDLSGTAQGLMACFSEHCNKSLGLIDYSYYRVLQRLRITRCFNCYYVTVHTSY